MTSNEDNEDFEENLCHICYENDICKNFKCNTCKNSVCLKCFKKLNDSQYDYIDTKKIHYEYKCPICITTKLYTLDDFDDVNEIKELANEEIFKIYENHFFKPDDKIEDIQNQLKSLLQTNSDLMKIEKAKNIEIEKLKQEIKDNKKAKDIEIEKLKQEIKDMEEYYIKSTLSFKEEKTLSDNELKRIIEFQAKTINNQVDNIKFLYENTKTKRLDKRMLKPFFENCINIEIKFK